MAKNTPASVGRLGDTGPLPGEGRPSGGGNGNPLQYPCLKNPRDRGDWWATVPGVVKNQTQLSTHKHTHTQVVF